tara:strand:- start:596 stop:1246 length:651 start_codon:yes stop_codon:yes gene_type:complete
MASGSRRPIGHRVAKAKVIAQNKFHGEMFWQEIGKKLFFLIIIHHSPQSSRQVMKKIAPPARLAAAFEQAGLADIDVLEFPDGTRSAADAARAVGCDISDIGKSLIFQGKNTQTPVLIIMNGADRVCENKVEAVIGEAIGKADATQVKDHTGYAIGGVPPFGHANAIRTLIDEKLLAKPAIWLAAGTPRSVFCLTPAQLCHITGITKGHILDQNAP